MDSLVRAIRNLRGITHTEESLNNLDEINAELSLMQIDNNECLSNVRTNNGRTEILIDNQFVYYERG